MRKNRTRWQAKRSWYSDWFAVQIQAGASADWRSPAIMQAILENMHLYQLSPYEVLRLYNVEALCSTAYVFMICAVDRSYTAKAMMRSRLCGASTGITRHLQRHPCSFESCTSYGSFYLCIQQLHRLCRSLTRCRIGLHRGKRPPLQCRARRWLRSYGAAA